MYENLSDEDHKILNRNYDSNQVFKVFIDPSYICRELQKNYLLITFDEQKKKEFKFSYCETFF
jgi:hypothetical protein